MSQKKSGWFIEGLRRFIRSEDGLVTVEWVALTAGMVVAAVTISFIVMNTTALQASGIGTGIQDKTNTVFGTNGENLGQTAP
jgi:hypothetical protein